VGDLEAYPHPQTWDAPGVTPRIAAQHSQFLFSAVGSGNTGSLRIAETPKAFLPIAISPMFKQNALAMLSDQFDIRYSTLFPDIYGFGHVHGANYGQYENERW
jgi:hypothetical protein